MSDLRRKGVRRSDLKIIASDPDLAAITKDVEALNGRLIGDSAIARDFLRDDRSCKKGRHDQEWLRERHGALAARRVASL
jgi:hypothetical protein